VSYKRKPPRFAFETGTRNGALVVRGVAPIEGGRWVAVDCDCGSEDVMLASAFAKKKVCSQACPMLVVIAEEHRRRQQESAAALWGPYRQQQHVRAAKLLRGLMSDSRRRLLVCHLTIEDIIEIRLDKACHYCGSEIGDCSGLDRIDCTGDYTRDNVLPCCANCNMARGHMLSVDEFKAAMAVRLAKLESGEQAWSEREWRKRTQKSALGGWGSRKNNAPLPRQPVRYRGPRARQKSPESQAQLSLVEAR
jgi:hypothetical protein